MKGTTNSDLTNEYIFRTKRLGFRPWRADDIRLMTEISSDPRVMRYFPNTQDTDHTRRFVERMTQEYSDSGYCYFATDFLESREFIGFIGLHLVDLDIEECPFVDIGWRLHPRYWGRGLATEGAKECLNYGLGLMKLKKIYAIAPGINLPSIRVMNKIGMHLVRVFEHPLLLENQELKSCVLYMTNPEGGTQ